MRGRGRVYRPTSGYTKEQVALWWLDYTVNGKRYRHSSGKTVKADAIDELEQAIEDRKNGRPVQPAAPSTLGAYVPAHLAAKAKETDEHGQSITARWLANVKRQLERAVKHFGADRLLGSITPEDVLAWVDVLRQTMSGGTARHHINSLSNLFAQAMRHDGIAHNPVAALSKQEKPKARKQEAKWLPVHEAALLLAAAKEYRPKRGDLGMPFAYPLLATFLLTGGRAQEVLGLEIDDVNPKRKTVTFRPNKWRRLKTAGSARTVRLWPQLEEILREYLPARLRMGGGTLLFPSCRTGQQAMLTDFRKLLDAVAKRAGWKAGEITPKMFRHTYISARIQTTDHGAPVAAFTVAREVGHSSTAMIEKVYGHLGQTRHRSKFVEYRVEQHKQAVKDLLKSRAGVRHTLRHTLRLVA